jgi:hypothetical protein
MKLNVRRNVFSNITSYASYPSMVAFFVPCQPQDKSFHVRDLRLLMLPSFSETDNINITRDPTYHRTFAPWKATTIPKKDPKCLKFLFIIILLVSIPNNSFSISNYCPFSFFLGFFYLLNFLP